MTQDNSKYSADGRVFLSADKEAKHIVVREGVQVIAPEAFLRADRMEQVELPEGLQEIGVSAFYHCAELKEITLPHSLTKLGIDAFYGCSELHTIHINGTFRFDESWLMAGYRNPFGYLQSIVTFTNTNPNFVVEDGVLYTADKTVLIRCSVYAGKVTLPNTLKYVLDNAFSHCRYLERVDLPDSVEQLGADVFSNCDSLREFIAQKSLYIIPDKAFYFCTNLAHLKLNDHIVEMGHEAFYGCHRPEFIDCPEGKEEEYRQMMINSSYEPVVHSPLIYTESCQALKGCLFSQQFAGFDRFLAPDVKLILQGEDSISGAEAVMNWLYDRYCKEVEPYTLQIEIIQHQHLKADCLRIWVPTERKYCPMMLILCIKDRKISLMMLGADLYEVGKNHKWELGKVDFEKDRVEPRPNRIPCLKCGISSEQLQWVKVGVHSKYYGEEGILSVCPHCGSQIEYHETLHYHTEPKPEDLPF